MNNMNGLRIAFVFCLLALASVPMAAMAADTASVNALGWPRCLTPGQKISVSVVVTNTGTDTWAPAETCPPDKVPDPSVPGGAPDCRHRLGYFINGTLIKGDRTDLLKTIAPGESANITATFCASDTSNTRDCNAPGNPPLPVGDYTADWQMLHEWVNWLPNKAQVAFHVQNNCSLTPDQGSSKKLTDLCRKVDCMTGTIIPPTISMFSNWDALTSQGQNIRFSGKGLGRDGAVLLLKGSFSRKPGAKFQILAPMTIELPIRALSGFNSFEAGPVPADLVGYDQDVTIQARTKSGSLSNELKIRFATKLDIKLLPRSAIKTDCVHIYLECCNGQSFWLGKPGVGGGFYCEQYVTNTVSVGHEAGTGPGWPRSGVDSFRGELNKGWKYLSMEGAAYKGTFENPGYSVISGEGHFTFKVPWTFIEQCWDDPSGGFGGSSDGSNCAAQAGYWLNIYVIGPMGMEP